jgi:hypothetical protein
MRKRKEIKIKRVIHIFKDEFEMRMKISFLSKEKER